MLTFYLKSPNSFTRKVEEQLQEMVVAHKIIRVDGDSVSLPDSIAEDDLPVLTDDRETFSSPQRIEEYLDGLHRELKTGRGLQSDACHLDPDNPEECL